VERHIVPDNNVLHMIDLICCCYVVQLVQECKYECSFVLLCRNWPTCMTRYTGLTLKWWKWCILGRGYLARFSEWHFSAR